MHISRERQLCGDSNIEYGSASRTGHQREPNVNADARRTQYCATSEEIAQQYVVYAHTQGKVITDSEYRD